ncbi:hypothetical protein GCM10023201_17800 [Actinomycetospora corticicola]|uniref:Uncharacterized protein n=1 Tax=Actinomycetospora corticicola TaxID=663602 RepID=A0A7Y9DUU6_9PSEU|nr:hypothetical protein [Actinomycetospora corticicola]NYD35865.1 hypothetical protein [Actinomycetospora corticicola]
MTTDADRVARERLAREARETATTLLDWVGTRVEGPRGPRPDGGERPRQSPGPCSWCPVCALVAALRGEQPELTATLAEQASGLLVLLRLLVQSHATGAHDHHAHPAPAPAAAEGPTPTPASTTPPAWPAEWGAPTWSDVPWDVAPHATFDPTPPVGFARPSDATPDPTPEPAPEPAVGDPRSATDRPTGRRGPRPSPRHTAGAPTAADDAAEPVVATGPVLRGVPGRRGVQHIPVRRRPRPC